MIIKLTLQKGVEFSFVVETKRVRLQMLRGREGIRHNGATGGVAGCPAYDLHFDCIGIGTKRWLHLYCPLNWTQTAFKRIFSCVIVNTQLCYPLLLEGTSLRVH